MAARQAVKSDAGLVVSPQTSRGRPSSQPAPQSRPCVRQPSVKLHFLVVAAWPHAAERRQSCLVSCSQGVPSSAHEPQAWAESKYPPALPEDIYWHILRWAS